MKGVRVLWVLLGLSGCADTDETTFENEGSLCFRSGPDGALAVVVKFPTCLGGCDELVEARCAIDVQAGEIVISSRAVVETTMRSGGCTDECGFATARCDSGPIEPGSYTLRHGTQSAPVVLPGQAALFSDAPAFQPCP